MTEPDAWLWKCRGCPVCDGEETEQFYRDGHAEVGGEFYELLPQLPIEKPYYDESDVDELRPLFSAETVAATAAELTQERNFEVFEEEQREAIRDFLEALWRELGYDIEEADTQ